MDKIAIMAELEKRGTLPPEKAGLLAEARKRGLVGGGVAPKKAYDPMVDPPRLPGEEGYDNTPSPAKAPGVLDVLASPTGLLDTADAAATVLSSAVTEPLAGLQGFGTTINNALGVNKLVEGRNLDPEVQMDQVRGFGYKPVTQGGSDMLSAVGEKMHKYMGGAASETTGDSIMEATDSPLLASLGQTLVGGAPDIMGAVAGVKVPKRIHAPVNTPAHLDPGLPGVRDVPELDPKVPKTDVERTRAAGFDIIPSEHGKAPFGEFLEGVGGSQNVRRRFNKKNEATATELASKPIGADPEQLGSKQFSKLKEPKNAAYEAMKTIGKVVADTDVHNAIGSISADKALMRNPEIAAEVNKYLAVLEKDADAAKVVESVKELRQQATFNQTPPAGGKQANPKKMNLGKAQRQIADALDDLLERNATAMGQPEVATRYRQARKDLAKINSVQQATVGRKVQASELSKQMDRDVPLSEELGVVADAGEAFPVSTSRPMVGTDAINPHNWIQDMIAPAVSKFLQSDMYQNSFGKKMPLGPVGGMSEHFQTPGPDFPPAAAPNYEALPPATGRSAIEANKRAGNLELAPDPVPNAQELPNVDTDPLDALVPPATPRDGLPIPQPNGTGRGPREIDTGDLALEEDIGARDSLPPFRDLSSELGLVEDAPVKAGPARRTGAPVDPDVIEFDPTPPEGPYRGPNTNLPLTEERPKVGVQRGASVNLAGDLGLMPDDAVPGNYAATGAPGKGPAVDDLAEGLGLSDEPKAKPKATAAKEADPFADRYMVPGSKRVSASKGDGYIAYEQKGKVRTINDAFVKPEARGKKIGQKNLAKLAEEAAVAGDKLNSDVSVTAAQLRAYESAKKAGLIDFDYSDAKAAAEALKSGTIAKAGGKPVIVNIRPFEEVVDVTE